MFTVTERIRKYHRVCGLPDRFAGVRLAILYLDGTITEKEYREWYDDANLATQEAMDSVVFEYLQAAEIGA
jgi:hypothetical protein